MILTIAGPEPPFAAPGTAVGFDMRAVERHLVRRLR
jgi:hypothetical protein